MCSYTRLFRISFCGYVFFSWYVEDNLYLWYCVEGAIGFHEGNDALAEVTDLDADIPQEGVACPSSHDHVFFWLQFGQREFHGCFSSEYIRRGVAFNFLETILVR